MEPSWRKPSTTYLIVLTFDDQVKLQSGTSVGTSSHRLADHAIPRYPLIYALAKRKRNAAKYTLSFPLPRTPFFQGRWPENLVGLGSAIAPSPQTDLSQRTPITAQSIPTQTTAFLAPDTSNNPTCFSQCLTSTPVPRTLSLPHQNPFHPPPNRLIHHQQAPGAKHILHGLRHLLEAARCALCLREPRDTQVRATAVFEHHEELYDEVDGSDLEICWATSARQSSQANEQRGRRRGRRRMTVRRKSG